MNADKVIEWITQVMGFELTDEQVQVLRQNFEASDNRPSGCRCHSRSGLTALQHENDCPLTSTTWPHRKGDAPSTSIMDEVVGIPDWVYTSGTKEK